jgi:hypothetical protein
MYYLISKLDPENHASVRRQPFTTKEEAIDRGPCFRTHRRGSVSGTCSG